MSSPQDVTVRGQLAEHPRARAFAQEVRRIHHRYATEVVGSHRLCPFMSDPETAFGRFCVMLEDEPSLEPAAALVEETGSSVLHIVYPLVTIACSNFERFGNRLHQEVARRMRSAPVHATFHPEMEGGRESPSRLVGLFRRAPDPFVQFVPEGLHEGGTTYANPASMDLSALLESEHRDRAKNTFERLDARLLDTIEATQRNIRADRDRSYARFLEALRAA